VCFSSAETSLFLAKKIEEDPNGLPIWQKFSMSQRWDLGQVSAMSDINMSPQINPFTGELCLLQQEFPYENSSPLKIYCYSDCAPACPEDKECRWGICEYPICAPDCTAEETCFEGACHPLETCSTAGAACGDIDQGYGAGMTYCGDCTEPHTECQNNQCITLSYCGDNICETTTENCSNCVEDCGCPTGEICNADNTCECPPAECPTDQPDFCGTITTACETQIICACEPHHICNTQTSTCEYDPFCGDGACNPQKEEDCATCAIDCGCTNDEFCNTDNTCECPDIVRPSDDYCGPIANQCGNLVNFVCNQWENSYCDTGTNLCECNPAVCGPEDICKQIESGCGYAIICDCPQPDGDEETNEHEGEDEEEAIIPDGDDDEYETNENADNEDPAEKDIESPVTDGDFDKEGSELELEKDLPETPADEDADLPNPSDSDASDNSIHTEAPINGPEDSTDAPPNIHDVIKMPANSGGCSKIQGKTNKSIFETLLKLGLAAGLAAARRKKGEKQAA